MVEVKEKHFGIIGYPLGHSLSPILHEFLLNKIDMKGCYHDLEVTKEKLDAVIQSMKTLGFTGFNVTIPYKQIIVSYLDEIHEEAQWIGAVNTVLINNNKLYGYNTDGIGFIQALINRNIDINEKFALVLGAGGAARAVVYSLIRHGLKKLWVLNRTPNRAELLANEVCKGTGFQNIVVGKLSRNIQRNAVESLEILINTTPLGMWPAVEATPISLDIISPDLTVIDLVYNPAETKFLKAARSAGANTMGGLEMLIFQGVEAMNIWTSMRIPIENFFNELKSKLTQKLKDYGKH
ncbi:MAG: shikimate dehydrogenase [bacterium]